MSDTTTTDAKTPVQVDIISDVMCPWCYIGKRRLEKALVPRAALPVAVRWHPFLLDPTIPPEGVDRRAYMERKFGAEAPRVYARIQAAGAEEGIEFAFDRITRSPNTMNAHRLIRWASAERQQDSVVERLFQLYFLEGADIGRADVLVEAARDAGMDGDAIAEWLASDLDTDLVRRDITTAQLIGITGVPFFIIQQRDSVVGAQSPEVIGSAIDHAATALGYIRGDDA